MTGCDVESFLMDDDRIPPLFPIQYRNLVRSALCEDLGRGGDLTSDAVVHQEAQATAKIVVREAGAIAGVELAASVFEELEADTRSDVLLPDGSRVERGSIVLRVNASARAILAAERTALNFFGHLSGVASLTRRFVDVVSGTGAGVVCTRKTTPGLRTLEKYAVRCGGGSNHRFGLDDAVLIKDNHLIAAGGVRNALERARAFVGHTVTVELEVDDLDQLEEGLAAGVDAVLLDNMSVEQLRKAVEIVGGRAVTEASGGITLDNAAEIAATGVDLISVGALTHSAPSLDISLEIELD